jgi:hypothetical protein
MKVKVEPFTGADAVTDAEATSVVHPAFTSTYTDAVKSPFETS